MEDLALIKSMVELAHKSLSVPVTAKIRIFPQVEQTIAYAKMLQDAGCAILTVHGRLREQKGHKTGMADWEQIKCVKYRF
jgi:tRNA-dihydrouridine synthase 1